MLLDCCLMSAIVIVATMLGQSTAQNYSTTITVDLRREDELRYSRTIVIPKGPMLRFLLPDSARIIGDGHLHSCSDTEIVCYKVMTQNLPMTSFELEYILDNQPQESINIVIDSKYKVGCNNYMHPQNAAMNVDAITLTCTPVPVNPEDFDGNVTMEWRRFSRLEDLQYFIQNCSSFPENCSDGFRGEDHLIGNGGDFTLMEYNLTIANPANNQAWFVPSFTVNNNRTYPATYTFLYRLPTITSHYEFSLEVFEPASNYNGLKCEAESFPPIKTFTWTRDGIDIDSSFTRYIFTNSTENDINGSITITQVTSNDSALFTCTVSDLGSLLKTDVSLSVRLRFKGRFRPLWPALGIIGVLILVALFIIIGHFYDKAIEKYQNEPSNPSHHKRLQSTTSTADETSNNVPSGKKQSASQADRVKYTVGDHMAVKRLSSARIQLLEEPQ